ncbi:MAG: tRNA lysidine(34) synthetase TilS [Elusimicrobia bacterium GWF2_52_66]|nr:MAG: tRNA lysidine(34) synthetase TilS [Elusimicrobia bacterium GWF2_52_66]
MAVIIQNCIIHSMHAKMATLRLWDKINSHSRRRGLFKKGDSILLAVSGGPDSIVLLDFFAKHARGGGLKLCVAHLNHRLRGRAADTDESFVKNLGLSYGLETVTARVDVPGLAKKMKMSVEHAARRARYGFLLKTALKKKCALVATAHHSDDHAETVMLNLMRGTEPKGLLGIPVKRKMSAKGKKNVFVIRPMLAVSRKEIMEYARLNRLSFRKDKTNEDEKHTRNWLRKTLLPLIERKQPRFRSRLLELSEKLSKLICSKYKGPYRKFSPHLKLPDA